ncbi:uncharacterized protein [Nicotiana tomentosiformis]|uniref:uncharacterized protein n=1 Tax=Nicotiana tomentosiformis TaxID=4098 RepID=UPI00388C3FFE
MPFPEKWNMNRLGKDVVMRSPSGDEELLPSAPKQAKEKKRKGAPSSPGSEKKKLARKSRKPKGDTGAMTLDLIRRLKHESEEEDNSKLMARVRAGVSIQKSSESAKVDEGALAIVPEPERVEATPSQDDMVERETGLEASRAAKDIPRDELGLIDISGSPQISDAMIREANTLEGRSYEGIQGATDVHGFLDVFESATLEDATGFCGLLALVLHHEVFLRIRKEHKAEVRQRLEQIEQLQTQVDAIQSEEEEFKKNMDILASKKETVQAQLELDETQLRAAKERASVQVEKIKELQSRLNLAFSDKASLANKLEVARSEVVVAKSEVTLANTKADAKVA